MKFLVWLVMILGYVAWSAWLIVLALDSQWVGVFAFLVIAALWTVLCLLMFHTMLNEA